MRRFVEVVAVLAVVVFVWWGDVLVGASLSTDEVEFVGMVVEEVMRDFFPSVGHWWEWERFPPPKRGGVNRYVIYSEGIGSRDWEKFFAGVLRTYEYGRVGIIAHYTFFGKEGEITVYLNGRRYDFVYIWGAGTCEWGKRIKEDMGEEMWVKTQRRVERCGLGGF